MIPDPYASMPPRPTPPHTASESYRRVILDTGAGAWQDRGMTNTIPAMIGIAPMKMTLEFNGDDEHLIQIAEYQNEEPLDSRDIGDAMGVFLTLCMMEGGEWTGGMPGYPHLVECAIVYEPFRWERNA